MAAPPNKDEISAPFPNPSNGVMRIGMGKLWEYVTDLLGMSGDAVDARAALGVDAQHGQCRLTKSGSNLLLQPYNGNKLIINGVQQTIPAAGVSLAATSLATNTTHYIYARMNGSTMQLEAVTTTHARDSTTGVEIKSGDATRTLVGMARTITGPAWQDTTAQRFVCSYFNRQSTASEAKATSDLTTSSTTTVELSTSIRIEFLTWADEEVIGALRGYVQSTLQPYSGLSFDNSASDSGYQRCNPAAGHMPIGMTINRTLTEGYHFLTMRGAVVGSGSATWPGTTNDVTSPATLELTRRG